MAVEESAVRVRAEGELGEVEEFFLRSAFESEAG